MSKCKVCDKQIGARHHAVECQVCTEKTHKRCNKLNDIDFYRIKAFSTPFFCIICTSELFPFSSLGDKQLSLLILSNININFDCLLFRHKHMFCYWDAWLMSHHFVMS